MEYLVKIGVSRMGSSEEESQNSEYSENDIDLNDLSHRSKTVGTRSEEFNHNLDTLKSIGQNFYANMDNENNMLAGVCNVCGMVKFCTEMSTAKIRLNQTQLNVIRSVLVRPILDDYLVCNICLKSLHLNKVPKMSLYNMGELQLSQPECLQKLTLAETILLSPARAFISMKRLLKGSYASSGNSITLKQDINEIASSLPINIRELPETLVYILVDKNKVENYHLGVDKTSLKKHCPELIVRNSVWLEAFQYLQKHSPVYKNITLNCDTYQSLPKDDIPVEILDAMQSVNTDDLNRQDLGHSQYVDEIENACVVDNINE
ncbi:MAG: hypothetical protein RLZZ86_2623 [Cyanobacteriota bacterium]